MGILKSSIFKGIFATVVMFLMFGAGYTTAKILYNQKDDDGCVVIKQKEESQPKKIMKKDCIFGGVGGCSVKN